MSIAEHFEDVIRRVKGHPLVKRLHVKSMQVSLKRGYVRLTALFVDNSELHIFEYVNSDLRRLSYAYHYQSLSGSMIFRYDNEPHYPDLSTFPHHRHIVQGSAPEASREVDIDDILREVTLHITRTRGMMEKSEK